ncbi:MAG: thioredoxin-disulfide reductase [Candidatus Bathyarchaeota archaeon]|jgi:thioredoxin reductase (NADPH)|nr:thioredoxin-disulfide reductase [Candidatus Bathyarchaeota archaeon A05DMB-5]MDH7558136.1 thioredoxin-disulfide reductase [Candidatus Bathyarchaeota archaeon]
MENWELIIIGAGPAGLAAGIYGARSGLKTLILEGKMAGGTAVDAPLIENYPGFQSINGMELAQKMAAHCRGTGVTIREFESVIGLDLKGEKKIVKTNRAVYEANAVIIASGSHYRELNVPGEKEFRGRGVSYCGICDGPLFKDKRVLVVGGGNSAVMTALYLAGLASEVKIAHRRSEFRAEEALVKDLAAKKNIEILWNTEVREIQGEKLVTKVILFNNQSGETREMAIDGVFIQVGEDPNSQLAKEAGVEVDERGYIKIDIFQRTNVPGVYAAGDVTNHPVKQVGAAVGQGITAALEAYGYIRRPYYKK